MFLRVFIDMFYLIKTFNLGSKLRPFPIRHRITGRALPTSMITNFHNLLFVLNGQWIRHDLLLYTDRMHEYRYP
jgi:hypothetical protein